MTRQVEHVPVVACFNKRSSRHLSVYTNFFTEGTFLLGRVIIAAPGSTSDESSAQKIT